MQTSSSNSFPILELNMYERISEREDIPCIEADTIGFSELLVQSGNEYTIEVIYDSSFVVGLYAEDGRHHQGPCHGLFTQNKMISEEFEIDIDYTPIE